MFSRPGEHPSRAPSIGRAASTTYSNTPASTCSRPSSRSCSNLKTVSFHLGAESATIDIEGGSVDARTILETERSAIQVV
ncbi:MAG TPA: hypothetical protein VMQ86_23435, partial [Bryobacteraceae bacterium]|nr:hypothetical protein [Bryobacteraceae bacterium]